MFLTFWTLINTLIIIAMIVGIPWFMITVIRLLTKIESRLESLEKTINNNNKRQDLEVHTNSF